VTTIVEQLLQVLFFSLVDMEINDREGTYNTGSADKIIKRYLKAIGVSWDDFWVKLDTVKVKLIFLMAIKDFKEKRISLDQLSTVGNDLYYNNNKWGPGEIILEDSSLDSILGDAAELAYYHWRQDKDPLIKQSYQQTLKNIEEYYQKNKFFLDGFLKTKQ